MHQNAPFSTQKNNKQQHPFNRPLSGVSRNQKGKISLDLLEQETVNGSGIR